MKNYRIDYLSFEGNNRWTTAKGEDEDDAVKNAIDAEGNYSGDNIYKVITVEEIGADVLETEG
jgi:hypothetical protein